MKAKALPLSFALALFLLLIVPSTFACGVCEVTITKEPLYSGYTKPDGTWVTSAPTTDLQLHTYYDWWVQIEVCTPYTITDVRVADRFGAEFGVSVVDYTGRTDGSHEAPVLTTQGKSEKVFLNWHVGTIEAGQCVSVWLHVWTDRNPACKQEFTSCETYYMNSGAVVKWLDSCGVQHSAETDPIVVSTVLSS